MNLDPEFDEQLTDEELDFLERFLSSNAVCDDTMDAVMLHGFLTAVNLWTERDHAGRDFSVDLGCKARNTSAQISVTRSGTQGHRVDHSILERRQQHPESLSRSVHASSAHNRVEG